MTNTSTHEQRRKYFEYGPGSAVTLRIDGDGNVNRDGIVTPKGTKVHQRTKSTITIKVPGHQYWSGRGSQGYAPAEYVVYGIVDGGEYEGRSWVSVNRIASFPVR